MSSKHGCLWLDSPEILLSSGDFFSDEINDFSDEEVSLDTSEEERLLDCSEKSSEAVGILGELRLAHRSNDLLWYSLFPTKTSFRSVCCSFNKQKALISRSKFL